MAINLEDLPLQYQQQALAQLAQRKCRKRRERLKCPKPKSEFASRGEYEFYMTQVLPLVRSGKIVDAQAHKAFDLLPAAEYCGIKLPAARYTPDYLLTYSDGSVEAVEIKCKFTRKSQRDYIYRRRLFIEKYCRPNGWRFREIITDESKEDVQQWTK